MTHGIQVCEYGYEHGRCRCPDTTIIHVTCDNPAHKLENAYKAKHAKEAQR
jgi:hypothetical protein